jgi:hypothetical protein
MPGIDSRIDSLSGRFCSFLTQREHAMEEKMQSGLKVVFEKENVVRTHFSLQKVLISIPS